MDERNDNCTTYDLTAKGRSKLPLTAVVKFRQSVFSYPMCETTNCARRNKHNFVNLLSVSKTGERVKNS